VVGVVVAGTESRGVRLWGEEFSVEAEGAAFEVELLEDWGGGRA
jgi:hypothetical protein